MDAEQEQLPESDLKQNEDENQNNEAIIENEETVETPGGEDDENVEQAYSFKLIY